MNRNIIDIHGSIFRLSASDNKHPIVTNIEAVKFEYASGIDTLPNALKKTVLLSFFIYHKMVGLPNEISFDIEIPKNLQVMDEGPSPRNLDAGELSSGGTYWKVNFHLLLPIGLSLLNLYRR